jgi:branched-chain amino acid transport system substrate-binding protein
MARMAGRARRVRSKALMPLVGSLAVVLAACGTPAEKGGTGEASTSGDIEIAFIGDFVNAAAPYSTASFEGAKLAVEEINGDGGVDGRDLVLSNYDDKNEPVQAVSIAQRVAPEAAAVIVGGSSSTTLAALPYIEQAGKPFFVTVSSNPGVTESGYAWANRVHLSDADQVKKLVEYTQESGDYERIALVHDTGDYGTGGGRLAEEALAQHDVEPVSVQTYNVGATDFSAQINALRDADVDAVIFWGQLDFGARFSEQMTSLGLADVQLLGGSGFVSDTYLELAGEAADGTIATWAYLDPKNPIVEKLSETYESRTGRHLDVFAAQSYDLVHLLAEAIEEAGTDPEALQQAIRASQYEGAVGPLSFDDKGQNVRQIELGVVRDDAWGLLD